MEDQAYKHRDGACGSYCRSNHHTHALWHLFVSLKSTLWMKSLKETDKALDKDGMIVWWEIIGLDFAPSPLLHFCFVSHCLSWISLYWRLYSCQVHSWVSDESKDAVEYSAKRCCQNTRMLTMVAAPRFHLSAMNPTSSVLTGCASSVGGVLLTCIFLIHSFSNSFYHASRCTRLPVCAGSRQHTWHMLAFTFLAVKGSGSVIIFI